MNTAFNLKQWLKQLKPVSPPQDDFAAIYQRVKTTKPVTKLTIPWALAATMAALAIGLVLFDRPIPAPNNSLNHINLVKLKQQINQMEKNLANNTTMMVGHPGSGQLENQVQLEQWLAVINNRLAENKNPQQQHNLLQAKLSVLQNLVPKPQTIQLI
ncbi:MAG: hypothetical protein OQK49_01120 [Proteobacteria bacterium]|nr:hypothetical protein [Pseudomonadota bacterium]